MAKIISFCILVFFTDTLFCQESYKQILNASSTMVFPTKPDSNVANGYTIFNLPMDSAQYLVVMMDTKNDPTMYVQPNDLDLVYERVIKGSMDAVEGQIIQKIHFTTQQGLKGVEVEYTSKKAMDISYIMFKRVLFVNDVLYNYDYWTLPHYKDLTIQSRELFFNSLQFNAQSLNQYSANYSEKKAYNRGYGFAGLLIPLLALGLIIYFVTKKFF
jgi:hypothetical protein